MAALKLEMPAEKDLIAVIRRRARGSSPELRLGIGDDCAILRPRDGEEIVVTTDFSLEGVHFRREWHSPESVGHRCLVRGLSDVAAMGARPVAAFLSMAVPEELLRALRGKSWVERFFDGFMALADRFEVLLAGGDTAQAVDRACFDIVVMGAVKRGRALLRSSAKPGDLVYVTGALGGAAAELMELERGARRFAGPTKADDEQLHLFPEPRIEVGKKLSEVRGVHAAIDVSDGLSTDLAHICEESGVSAEIDAAAIPVHALAIKAERAGWVASELELALHGGEDYELLFTASAEAKVPRKIAGVDVRRIGRIVRIVRKKSAGPGMMLRLPNGDARALEARGWEHFRKGSS